MPHLVRSGYLKAIIGLPANLFYGTGIPACIIVLDKEGANARKAPPPPVARYVSETGSGFVLDRDAPMPLLKFDNSPEVWVLSPQPASRGSQLFPTFR